MGISLDAIEPLVGERLHAVIEASAGTRSKFKYEPSLGMFTLHHVLPAGTSFPLDFGFLPNTHGADGDPLDVLVFADEPLPVGVVVPCRLVGVIEALQASRSARAVRNDRYLAVADASRAHAGWSDLAAIPRELLVAVETFFVSYNAQRSVTFEVKARRGAVPALRGLRRTLRRGSG